MAEMIVVNFFVLVDRPVEMKVGFWFGKSNEVTVDGS